MCDRIEWTAFTPYYTACKHVQCHTIEVQSIGNFTPCRYYIDTTITTVLSIRH